MWIHADIRGMNVRARKILMIAVLSPSCTVFKVLTNSFCHTRNEVSVEKSVGPVIVEQGRREHTFDLNETTQVNNEASVTSGTR